MRVGVMQTFCHNIENSSVKIWSLYTARVMTRTCRPVTIRAGSKGCDSNLLATIRAGNKGCDSNLPASYHQGWQQGLWLEPASQLPSGLAQGLWLEPASQLPSGLAARVMTQTCQPVTGSCWRTLERMWRNHLLHRLMIRVWRYSVVDFNIRLIQLIAFVDSISCALSLWCWCVFIFFVFGQCLIGSIP